MSITKTMDKVMDSTANLHDARRHLATVLIKLDRAEKANREAARLLTEVKAAKRKELVS